MLVTVERRLSTWLTISVSRLPFDAWNLRLLPRRSATRVRSGAPCSSCSSRSPGFAPMWAFGCGVRVLGRRRSGTLAADRRRRRAGRTAGLRHQPGGQRLVRPACRRDQRAEPADPVGPHARPLGPLHRHRLDRAVAAGGDRCSGPGASARRWSGWRWPGPTARRRSGSSATAGGATAAVAACYEGLPWFTGAAVMAGGASRTGASSSLARALQRRRPRHHDAQRLQVGRGRPPHGHRLAAGAARRRARGPGRLPVHGAAAAGRGGAAAGLGPADPCGDRGAAAARAGAA